MALIAIQTLTDTGLNPTYTAAAAAGDSIVNSGNDILIIRNTNAASRTVTILTQRVVNGLAVADKTMTIGGASGMNERFIGKLDKTVYNILSGANAGQVQLTYSTEVGLSVAHIRLG